MEHVVGIDLGTSNTVVAVMENGVPIVIPNKGGYKTTPSMVGISESGKRLIGHIAKRQVVTNSSNTVYAAKRLIGRKWGTKCVDQIRESCAYQMVKGPRGDVRIELRGEVYSVPEISAFILQELKAMAEQYLGEDVQKAVITVPAYFNDNQRQATKDAGRIAGLEVIRIINEPTAAALAYGFERDFERKIAVYDLGGGTFDVSVMQIGKGVYEVLSTSGDSFLGGADFDIRIMDWLMRDFETEHGIDLRHDRMALQRIRDASEKARCELSVSRETLIDLPFLHTNPDGHTFHLQKSLSRNKLEELTQDLVARTIEICEQTLAEAKFSKSDLDDVVLVGGVTRMPLIQQRVRECFGVEPCKGVHPDEVVALGAGVQAAALAGHQHDVLLLDVTPQALGIMVQGGGFHELIAKNTTVPTSFSHPFTTIRDNQSTVKIVVMQGASAEAAENELLGEFSFTGLRRAPKGEVEVEVTFSISADGIVQVAAKDPETGREQGITVSASSGLSEEELQRLETEHSKEGVSAAPGAGDSASLSGTYGEQELNFSENAAGESQSSGSVPSPSRNQLQLAVQELHDIVDQASEVMQSTAFGRSALDNARELAAKAQETIDSGGEAQVQEQLEAVQRSQQMLSAVVNRSRSA